MKSKSVGSNQIENVILLIKKNRVILDTDLAMLYGIKTKALNQAVKRNSERFPEDFIFQLSDEEKIELVTNCDRFKKLKHSLTAPYAFTEHGALMAANVLNSSRAIEMSVYIVRAFIKLRELVSTNIELASKLQELEQKLENHDSAIRILVASIRKLTEPTLPTKRRRLGF
jgi:chromosome condensin MukBEF ATPase and DNA-binding subunit MukB